MYKIRHLICSTISVLSGMKSFSMKATLSIWRMIPWDQFAAFTSLYIRILILPRPAPPTPLPTTVTFGGILPYILCAMTQAIIRTRHLTFATKLDRQLPLPLSCVITLRIFLLLSPIPACLPRLHLPHFMSTKVSRTCYHLRTTYLFQGHSTPLIIHPS